MHKGIFDLSLNLDNDGDSRLRSQTLNLIPGLPHCYHLLILTRRRPRIRPRETTPFISNTKSLLEHRHRLVLNTESLNPTSGLQTMQDYGFLTYSEWARLAEGRVCMQGHE